jgi:hypothetical protein
MLIQCERRKKDNSDVSTSISYGVASFLSWSKSICNPETGIMKVKGALTTIAYF